MLVHNRCYYILYMYYAMSVNILLSLFRGGGGGIWLVLLLTTWNYFNVLLAQS